MGQGHLWEVKNDWVTGKAREQWIISGGMWIENRGKGGQWGQREDTGKGRMEPHYDSVTFASLVRRKCLEGRRSQRRKA